MVDWLDRRLRRLRVAVRLLAAALIIAIAGCAPPPDLEAKTGRELQSRVLAVTTAAATGDPATGLRTLDELVEHLTRAAANGDVSFKRHQSIMKAVEAVRASLRAAAAAEAAASKAAAEKAAAATAAAEKATAAKESEAAAEGSDQNLATNQPTVTLAPQPAQTPQSAKEAPARGSDKGKGKKDG
ncbi:mucin-associated surface protein [Arthrobacter sp. ISL-28]|uniref:mucin-associated surface protein n=1 Tax=Arthrobacter sp. ISL-28 TaxID=2819108 RepID=UPI001BE7FA36|nr:mucin-associated surface protein [Arthrobacter sp. ISL-28]MBT2519491.1 mucin-associated surface protein [Arthrobacter sp. ISL-28]